MRLSKSWIIASKDFSVFRKKKNIIYSIFIIPLLVSFLLPAVTAYAENYRSNFPASAIPILLSTSTFFYVIVAGLVPSTIASYSIVGEKVEKSLEPLLATPTTDSEILFGKGISSFLPPMAMILAGAAIYMGLMDLVTHSKLGYYYFPNWNAAIVLFVMVPLGRADECGMECNCIVQGK